MEKILVQCAYGGIPWLSTVSLTRVTIQAHDLHLQRVGSPFSPSSSVGMPMLRPSSWA